MFPLTSRTIRALAGRIWDQAGLTNLSEEGRVGIKWFGSFESRRGWRMRNSWKKWSKRDGYPSNISQKTSHKQSSQTGSEKVQQHSRRKEQRAPQQWINDWVVWVKNGREKNYPLDEIFYRAIKDAILRMIPLRPRASMGISIQRKAWNAKGVWNRFWLSPDEARDGSRVREGVSKKAVRKLTK